MAENTEIVFPHQIPDDGVPQWPNELHEWRLYPPNATLRNMYNVYLWREMIPAFTEQGIVPYTPDLDSYIVFCRRPPNPDEFVLPAGAYRTKPDTPIERYVVQSSASVYPAVLPDGSDVFVRVVSKGPEPSQQLRILRYLASEPRRSHPENHSLPLLKELTYKDWTFIVMPRFSSTIINHFSMFADEWFTTAGELLEFVEQTLEAFAFLHDHLIAHQDIYKSNFVHNHIGSWDGGFLSRFPVRYYVIDFEHAVQFPPTSASEERRVVGPPVEGFAPQRRPPEMGVGDGPHSHSHCPFAADVWQLGLLYFTHFSTQVPALCDVARAMLAPRPEARPTMRAALEQVRAMQAGTHESQTRTVSRNYLFDNMKPPEFAATLDAFVRGGADVEFVNLDESVSKVVPRHDASRADSLSDGGGSGET